MTSEGDNKMKNKFALLIVLITAVPVNNSQAGIFWDNTADKYEKSIKACQGYLLDHSTAEESDAGMREFRKCVELEKEYYFGKK